MEQPLISRVGHQCPFAEEEEMELALSTAWHQKIPMLVDRPQEVGKVINHEPMPGVAEHDSL